MNSSEFENGRRVERQSRARLGAEPSPPYEALERVRRLYEISRLLTAFRSIDEAFPAVIDLVAKMLPLRSAILVVSRDAGTSTMAWTPEGLSPDIGAATAHAEGTLAYLLDPRFGRPPVIHLDSARLRVVALPMVVDPLKIFGVLQLEGEVLEEMDLHLVNAVANQLAVALRRSELEAERESLFARERNARAEAEEANRAKDEFLAVLSHELRTPLNAIYGWAHLLVSGTLDAQQAADAVERIRRNAEIQKHLIADILDIPSIVSGNLRMEIVPMNLVTVIESARETVRPAADAKQISICFAPDLETGRVAGDAGRLRQVVWNLLTNAVKFTPAGGRVEVVLGRRDDGHMELTISDDGPGIPVTFLPHVFERFRQADSSPSRRHGGLGLGLAIVKNIVGLHGGTVTAANRDGGGAVFTVRLPPAPVREAAVERRSDTCDSETTSLAGVRVLVVDDMPDDRAVLKMLLEQQGAEVLTASSAEEGLTTLERERPDVLLSDIGMPGEDGYALMRRVRKLPAEGGGLTPGVAVTAFAGADERERALAAGFNAHLAKPMNPRGLAKSVHDLAHGRRLRRKS